MLPPRQRVVLTLRDVLAWTAQECADLLDSSVASINSALARAREDVSERDPVTARAMLVEDDETLLMNYAAAFEAYDVERLVRLLTEDASFSMPPFPPRGESSPNRSVRAAPVLGGLCRQVSTPTD